MKVGIRHYLFSYQSLIQCKHFGDEQRRGLHWAHDFLPRPSCLGCTHASTSHPALSVNALSLPVKWELHHKAGFLCISQPCSPEKSRQLSMAHKLQFCHEFIIREKLVALAGMGMETNWGAEPVGHKKVPNHPSVIIHLDNDIHLDNFHLKLNFQLFSPLTHNPILVPIIFVMSPCKPASFSQLAS